MRKLLPPQEPLNAEGYCKKCGTELGIEGRCYVCAVRFLDLDESWADDVLREAGYDPDQIGKDLAEFADQVSRKAERKFQDALTCKICGQPKYHSRLYGYRCWNPEHNTEEA